MKNILLTLLIICVANATITTVVASNSGSAAPAEESGPRRRAARIIQPKAAAHIPREHVAKSNARPTSNPGFFERLGNRLSQYIERETPPQRMARGIAYVIVGEALSLAPLLSPLRLMGYTSTAVGMYHATDTIYECIERTGPARLVNIFNYYVPEKLALAGEAVLGLVIIGGVGYFLLPVSAVKGCMMVSSISILVGTFIRRSKSVHQEEEKSH